MKLFTKEIVTKLQRAGTNNTRPICKLFAPWGAQTWLITGIEDGILYGYADLGMGCVEWGSVSTINEMESIRGPFNLRIERDLHFSDDPEIQWTSVKSLVGV